MVIPKFWFAMHLQMHWWQSKFDRTHPTSTAHYPEREIVSEMGEFHSIGRQIFLFAACLWPDWATVTHSSDIRQDGSYHPIGVMYLNYSWSTIFKVILVIILRKIERYVHPVLLSTEKHAPYCIYNNNFNTLRVNYAVKFCFTWWFGFKYFTGLI